MRIPFSPGDRAKIRALMTKAAAQPILDSEIERLAKAPFEERAKSALQFTILLDAGYSVTYNHTTMMGNGLDEHLSIGPIPPRQLPKEEAIAVAAEFGMGDDTTWRDFMPQKPGQLAFHIFRLIRQEGAAP